MLFSISTYSTTYHSQISTTINHSIPFFKFTTNNLKLSAQLTIKIYISQQSIKIQTNKVTIKISYNYSNGIHCHHWPTNQIFHFNFTGLNKNPRYPVPTNQKTHPPKLDFLKTENFKLDFLKTIKIQNWTKAFDFLILGRN